MAMDNENAAPDEEEDLAEGAVLEGTALDEPLRQPLLK